MENSLQKWRVYRGYTQKHLCKTLKISQSLYSKYENGKKDIPYRKLMVIANFLGVHTKQIVDTSINT